MNLNFFFCACAVQFSVKSNFYLLFLEQIQHYSSYLIVYKTNNVKLINRILNRHLNKRNQSKQQNLNITSFQLVKLAAIASAFRLLLQTSECKTTIESGAFASNFVSANQNRINKSKQINRQSER